MRSELSAHHTVTFSLEIGFVSSGSGFSSPQIHMFCLLTWPERWKWASSLQSTFITLSSPLSILSDTVLTNLTRFVFCSLLCFWFTWILYGNLLRSFRRIRWTVGHDRPNSRAIDLPDFLGVFWTFMFTRLIFRGLRPVKSRPDRFLSWTEPLSSNLRIISFIARSDGKTFFVL